MRNVVAFVALVIAAFVAGQVGQVMPARARVKTAATPRYSTTSGDVNCDQRVDVSDAVSILAWLFTGGDAPCAFGDTPEMSARVEGLEDRVHSLETSAPRRSILPLRCMGSTDMAIGQEPVKVADLGTFAKGSAATAVEALLVGRLWVNTLTDSSGVIFELRIDDQASRRGTAQGLLKLGEEGGYGGVPAAIAGVFEELPAGAHTVSLWAWTPYGSATGALVDPGCWDGSSQVILTERM